jgi:eukaryotic-like serine/threonine-protein kinase
MAEGRDATGREEREALSDTEPAVAPDTGGLIAGASIGHFVVERELGRGSTAVVLAAYDPTLERRVAIKLLHPGRQGISPERSARFLREARALAKLRHPNVITVYQVGTWSDQVFIAMEIVEGETLGRWIDRARPGPREIMDAFLLAGRGLAAAHRAGLVHRDFKPENVLRDKDGRILVTDFGLVAAPSGASPEVLPSPDAESLTQTGEVMGTPRYMSPEQHSGQAADSRADQFSFAVALYEALYRQLPFAGADWASLRENVLAGRLNPAPRPASVPRRVVAALRRALATDPAARFPAMDALIASLERRPLVTVARVAVLAALVAGGLVAFGVVRDRGRACSGAAQQVAGVWDDAHRAAVRASFLKTGRPHAESTYERVAAALDDYAAAWMAMRTEACKATVRREQSEADRSLRMRCLDQRLAGFSALIRVFVEVPSPELVDGAIRAARGLEGLAGCADAQALAARVPPPPRELAGRVAGIRERLDQARALLEAGRTTQAGERLGTLIGDARATGYQPLLAEALLALGETQAAQRDAAAAHATIEEAMTVAAEVKDDAAVARATALLMETVAVNEGRPAEALALRPAMEAAVRRAGNDEELRARAFSTVGAVLHQAGTYAEAEKELDKALTLRKAALNRNDVEIVRTEITLAKVLVKDGKYDDARAQLTAAAELGEKVLGREHPDVAAIYTELGNVAFHAGKNDDALARYQKALDILRAALGEEAEQVGAGLQNVAMIVDEQGRYDEALAIYRQALAIREKALGADNPVVATTITDIAITLVNKGDLQGARESFERVVAIREKAAPGQPELATAYLNLANVLADLQQLDAAVSYMERSLAIRRKTLRADHPFIAKALTELGKLEIDRGKADQAVPLLEEALTILGDDPQNEVPLAKARFRMAQALWRSGGDRKRARDLTDQARAFFASHELAKWVTAVDQWIAKRPTERPPPRPQPSP